MLASFIKKMQANFDDIPDLLHTSGKYDGKMKGKYATLQEKIKATTELAHVYAAYETALAKRHLYDFEDMINEAVRALSENEEMLMTIQEKYQYILADEHQDANASQNQLLELVSGFFDRPNLFIVGDEKQEICPLSQSN
jgi:DNA helicase-2/ATP-dependent DNA helicase PcrA